MRSRAKVSFFSGFWTKRARYVFSFVLLGFWVYGVLLGGCATRPLKEMTEAERAFNLAEEAGAQRYAASSLKRAEEALTEAQKLSEKGEYQKARSWAVESKQKAQIAREEAIWTQEKFKKEAFGSLEAAEKALSQSEQSQAASRLEKELELAKETIIRAKLALDLKSYEEARDLALLAKSQAQGLIEAAKKAEAEAARQAEKERIKEKRSIEALNQGITAYKVKYGETLWMIAGYSEVYNDPLLWPIIYKANRDQIRDPEVIFADQSLKIPRNITEEQRSAAIKESSEGTWFKHSTMGDKESNIKESP